ncbi:hypothetical protein [Ktedonospora formicarum]|uniref:hypothetical protein n=1 Tax=Ktedonospora formicarum TaxID=2778364 RepID=UPI001C68C949|nr:hypothetical protein [Ktedonospora formicarum]
MKYIEAAIILLGFLIGALVGCLIPLYDGNAALLGALLVPALGPLGLFFVKQRHKKMSLEGRNQQNQVLHQHYVGSANSKTGQVLFSLRNSSIADTLWSGARRLLMNPRTTHFS